MQEPRPKSLIDIHIHVPPLSREKGDIFNPTPLRRLFMDYLRKRASVDEKDPFPEKSYLKKLQHEIKNSRYVSKGVVLAMDGVYTEKGELDAGNTRFMVTNDSVFAAAKEYPELLAGASINPRRKDAIDELVRCREKGAVLVKIIPSTQGFNPSEKRFMPFFKKMSELKMPLLSHCGYEFVFSTSGQYLANPFFLKTALDCGVLVVVAHGGSSGLFLYERYFNTIKGFVKDYPNFFLDVSAVTFPTRARMILKIRNEPGIKTRLFFGSDYPVPSFSFPFKFHVKKGEYLDIKKEGNFFDRLVLIFKALDIEFMPSLQEILMPLGKKW